MGLLMGSTGCLECHPISRNSGKMSVCGQPLPVNKQYNPHIFEWIFDYVIIIQNRGEFESDGNPELNKDLYLQDIHCVSSLCKAYFRELPNPLLTYQLYDKFAVSISDMRKKQNKILDWSTGMKTENNTYPNRKLWPSS